jgi:hypothetical protein
VAHFEIAPANLECREFPDYGNNDMMNETYRRVIANTYEAYISVHSISLRIVDTQAMHYNCHTELPVLSDIPPPHT